MRNASYWVLKQVSYLVTDEFTCRDHNNRNGQMSDHFKDRINLICPGNQVGHEGKQNNAPYHGNDLCRVDRKEKDNENKGQRDKQSDSEITYRGQQVGRTAPGLRFLIYVDAEGI